MKLIIALVLSCVSILYVGLMGLEGKNPSLFETEKKSSHINILSLDGGGVKGIITLTCLERLKEEFKDNLLGKFKVYAGTSTGALSVLALAIGMTPKELMCSYPDYAQEIFAHPKFFLERFFCAKYSTQDLQKFIVNLLECHGFSSDSCLGDVLTKRGIHIIIPVIAWIPDQGWRMKVFENFTEEGKKIYIVDALVDAVSAPTFFSNKDYIDAGVCNNNPALIAAIYTAKFTAIPINNIAVLSIGTGIIPSGVPEDTNWGDVQWLMPRLFHGDGIPLLNLMWKEEVDESAKLLETLLPKSSRRIDMPLSKGYDLDDHGAIPSLQKEAEEFCDRNKDMIEAICGWLRKVGEWANNEKKE